MNLKYTLSCCAFPSNLPYNLPHSAGLPLHISTPTPKYLSCKVYMNVCEVPCLQNHWVLLDEVNMNITCYFFQYFWPHSPFVHLPNASLITGQPLRIQKDVGCFVLYPNNQDHWYLTPRLRKEKKWVIVGIRAMV